MNNSIQKNKFTLAKVIIDDLIENQKLSLLLIGLIIISAMMILWTTQQTRRELFTREQLLLERDVLETEWRNLIIEENVLADPKRIEQKAYQIGMQYVTPKDETTIIVIKNR